MSDTLEELYAARDLLHSAAQDAFRHPSPTHERLVAANSAIMQTVSAVALIVTEFTEQLPAAEQQGEISPSQFRVVDYRAANARTILLSAMGELHAVQTALAPEPG